MSNQPLQYESPQTSGWTKQEVAVLVVKVIAIYCVVEALPAVGYLTTAVLYVATGAAGPGWSNTFEFVLWTVPALLYLAVAAALWMASGWLAQRLLGRGYGEPMVLPPMSELHLMALSVVGVLMMVWAISEAASILVYGYSADAMAIGSASTFGGLVATAIQFILGLVLFLRAPGFALLWQKVRTGGVVPHDYPPPRQSDTRSDRP